MVVGVFLLIGIVLAGSSITTCRIPQKYEYSARYILEVVNNAADSARVHIHVGSQDFKEIPTGLRRSRYGSGIMVVASGARRVFEMRTSFGPKDSPEDNELVRAFGSIEFFRESSDTPYRSYDYPLAGCSDAPLGSDCSDDMWYAYRHTGGPGERLFVESPDRPFYLERDREDPDLARIVITFVPDASAGSVDALN